MRGDQPCDVIPGPSAGGPRGDHPRNVIPRSSAGDALGAGNIDLPADVQATVVQDRPPDVENYLGHSLGGAYRTM